MGNMTAAVRETRNANELAGQRAGADEVLAPGYDPEPYEVQVAAAWLAALDWIEGRRDTAPVSGDLVEATERAIHDERVLAEEAEEAALRKGLDGTYPGQVGVALSWFHKRTWTEAPY